MTKVDDMEFYQEVVGSEQKSESYVIEHSASNKELEVEITEVDRQFVLDELARLPDELLETFDEAEDEQEAQELAEDSNLLSGVNGDTILAFENLCAESLRSEKLTSDHFEDIVKELDFEVLFEMGSKVIDMSIGDTGSIKGFRKVDSDKSS